MFTFARSSPARLTGKRGTRRSVPRLFGSCVVAVLFAVAGSTRAAEAVPPASVAGPGDADPADMCFTWEGETRWDCPTAEELETAVHETLGRTQPSSRRRCDVRVAGSLRASEHAGWTISLHFTRENGELLGDRSLDIQDVACAAAKDPMSLVIALMVEGNVAENIALHVRAPGTRRDVVTSAETVRSLSAGASVSSGLLPTTAFGATIAFGSGVIAKVPLELETTVWLPTEKAVRGPDGEFSSWVAGLGLCPTLLAFRRLGVQGCLRLLGGVIRGVGLGLDEQKTATRPWAAVEVGAPLLLRLSRQIALYASVGVAGAWLRPRFVYFDGQGAALAVHEPRAWVPLGGIGLAFVTDDAGARGGAP